MILNKLGYSPLDDDSETGFRRPPRDPACVCDYFSLLFGVEDGGAFAHSEMRLMLESPTAFFADEDAWQAAKRIGAERKAAQLASAKRVAEGKQSRKT